MKLTKDFYLQEFVPPEIFNTYGKQSIQFIHPGLPLVAQGIRDFFGAPVTVNNWHNLPDGSREGFKERGFRLPTTKTGALFSPHKRGIGLDHNVEGISAEEERIIIIANEAYFMKLGITRMESNTLSWVHVDMAWTMMTTILVFDP